MKNQCVVCLRMFLDRNLVKVDWTIGKGTDRPETIKVSVCRKCEKLISAK